MPINYKDNQRFVIPLLNEGPGRRTGWELKKEARKDSDGFEIFDDYWSDSSDQSSISADSTAKQIISTKRKTNLTPNTRKSSLLKPMSSFSSGGFSTKSSTSDNSTITTKENTTQHVSPKAVQEGDLNGSLSIIDTSKAPNSALQSFKTKKRLTFSTEEHLKQVDARNKANECVEVEPVITNVEARHQHDVDHNSGEELNTTLVADEANEPIDSMTNGDGASANKDDGQLQTSPQAEKIVSDRSRRSVAFKSLTVPDDVLESGSSNLGTDQEDSDFLSFKRKSVVNSTEINVDTDNNDSDSDNDDDDDGFDIVEIDTAVYTQGYGNSRKSLANSTKNSKLTSESDFNGHNGKVTVSTTGAARKNDTKASQSVNESTMAAKSTAKNRSKTRKGNTSSPASRKWDIDDYDDDEEKEEEEEEELATNQPKKASSYRNKGKTVRENRDDEIGSGLSDGNDRFGKTLSVKRMGRTRKKQEPLQEKAKSEKRKKPGKKKFDEGTENSLEDDDLESNNHDALVVDTVPSDDDVVDIDTGVYTQGHKNSRKSGRLAKSTRKSKLTSESESGGMSDGEKFTVNTKNKRRRARTIKTQASQLVNESEIDTAKPEKNTGKSQNKTQKESASSPGRRKWNVIEDDEEVEEEFSTNQPKKSLSYRNKRKTFTENTDDEIQSGIGDGNDKNSKALSVKRTGRTRKIQGPLQEMAKSEKRKKSAKKKSDEETEDLMEDDNLESNDHDALVDTVPSDDDVDNDAIGIDTGVNTQVHKNSRKSGRLAKSTRKSKLTSGSESGGMSDGEKVTVSTKNKRRGARTINTQASQLVNESEIDTAKPEKNTGKSQNKTQKESASTPGRRKWNVIEDDEEEDLEEFSTNQPKKSLSYRNKRKTFTENTDDEIQSGIGDANDKNSKALSVKRTGRTRKIQGPLQEMPKSEKRKKSAKKTSDEETEDLMEDDDLESNDHDALVDTVSSDDDVDNDAIGIDTGVNTQVHKNSRKSERLAKSTMKSKSTSESEIDSLSDGHKVTSTKNKRKGSRRNKTQASQLVNETEKPAKSTARSTSKTRRENTSRQAREKWYDIEDDDDDDVVVEEEELELSIDQPKKPSRYRNKRKTDTRIMDDIGDGVEEVVGEENLEELSTSQLVKVSSNRNMDDKVRSGIVDVNNKEVQTVLSVKRTGKTRKKQEPLQKKAKPKLRKKSGNKTSDEDTENWVEDNDDHDALVVDTIPSKSRSKRGPRQKSKPKHLQQTNTGDIEDDVGLKGTDDGFTETSARSSTHRHNTAESFKNDIRDAITEPPTKGNRKKRSKSLYNPENCIFEGQENYVESFEQSLMHEGTVRSPTKITGSENEIQVKKKSRQRKSTVRFSLDEELHSTSPRRSIASKNFSTSRQATSTDDDDDDGFPLQITKSSGLYQTECADDLDRALEKKSENDAMPSTKKQAVKRKKKTEIFETGAEEDVNGEDYPTAKHVRKTLKQKSPSPNTRLKKRGDGKASSSSTTVSSEEGEFIKRPRRGISQQKGNFDQTDVLTHSQFAVDDMSMDFTPARAPSDSTPIKSILKSAGQRKSRDSSVQDSANMTMKYFEMPRKKAYIIDPPDVSEDGIRRTKRHRVKPLEYWRNERPIYERRKSGGFSLSGIQSPTVQTPSPTAVKPRRKRKVIPKTPHNLSIHTDLSDVDLEEKVNPTVTVINPSNDEEVEIDAIVTGKMNQFYGPTGKPSKETDNISICKCLYQKSFSAGELIIRPLQEKGLQFVRNDTVVFRVLRGKVAVKIHETVSVLESGAMFFIPKGNVYNIQNLRKDEAKLVFIQVKGSIKS